MAELQNRQNVEMSKWPMGGLSSTASRRKMLWMKFRQHITKITKRRSLTKQVVLPPNDEQLSMNKGRAGCDIQKVEGNVCKMRHGDVQRALADDENSPSAGSIDHGKADEGTQVDENMLEAEEHEQEIDKGTQVDEHMLEANEGAQVDESPQDIEQRVQEADESSVEAREDSVETNEDMLIVDDGVQKADESLQEVEQHIQEANENSVVANEDVLEDEGALEIDEPVLEADEDVQEADESSFEANEDMLSVHDGSQEADESPQDIEEGISKVDEAVQEANEGSVEADEDMLEDEDAQGADDDILEADQDIQELAYHLLFNVEYDINAPIHEYDEDEHRHFQLQMKPLSSKIARAVYRRHIRPTSGDGEATLAAQKPMLVGVTECPICRETINDGASSWFCSDQCGQNFHFDCVIAWWKTDDVCRGSIEDETALIETRCAYCRTVGPSMYLFAEDDGHSASTIYLFLPWVRAERDGHWEVLAYSAKVPFIYRIFY